MPNSLNNNLNANEYHKPNKRHGLSDQIYKQDPAIDFFCEIHLLSEDV